MRVFEAFNNDVNDAGGHQTFSHLGTHQCDGRQSRQSGLQYSEDFAQAEEVGNIIPSVRKSL